MAARITAFIVYLWIALPAFSQISGTVLYVGDPPADDAYNTEENPLWASHVPGLNPLWRVGAHGGLESVVVFVKFAPGKSPASAPPAGNAQLRMKGWAIEPHVLAVRVGQIIELSNVDNERHTCEGECKLNDPFGRELRPVNTRVMLEHLGPFKREENFRVRCARHRWMAGWICCFDHPYFAVTSVDGTFAIAGPLPDGEYSVALWHESGLTETKTVNVKDGKGAVDFAVSAPPKAKKQRGGAPSSKKSP